MSTNPERPRRSGAATFIPLVVGVCATLLLRFAFEALFPYVSVWIAFIVAVVGGAIAYTLAERAYARRDRG